MIKSTSIWLEANSTQVSKEKPRWMSTITRVMAHLDNIETQSKQQIKQLEDHKVAPDWR